MTNAIADMLAAVRDAYGDTSTQRTRRRDSLYLSGRLRVDGREPVEVRVRNLSEGGLMAEGAPPLAIGTAVEIELRNIGFVSGKVAWCVDDRAGVAFDAAIDPKKARKPVAVRPASIERKKIRPC